MFDPMQKGFVRPFQELSAVALQVIAQVAKGLQRII
jgi:hypothetical protein